MYISSRWIFKSYFIFYQFLLKVPQLKYIHFVFMHGTIECKSCDWTEVMTFQDIRAFIYILSPAQVEMNYRYISPTWLTNRLLRCFKTFNIICLQKKNFQHTYNTHSQEIVHSTFSLLYRPWFGQWVAKSLAGLRSCGAEPIYRITPVTVRCGRFFRVFHANK